MTVIGSRTIRFVSPLGGRCVQFANRLDRPLEFTNYRGRFAVGGTVVSPGPPYEREQNLVRRGCGTRRSGQAAGDLPFRHQPGECLLGFSGTPRAECDGAPGASVVHIDDGTALVITGGGIGISRTRHS